MLNGQYENQALELLFERSSCRNLSQRKIPPEVLKRVLAAGTHAPTAGNLQPYSIIKIEDEQRKRRLVELAGGQAFVASAAVDLIFCIDWRRLERWAELEVAPFTSTSSFRNFWYSFQDTIICAQNVCTAADSLGLGSVYVGLILESLVELREMLQLPKRVLPVVLLCLGYPASRPKPATKLGTDVVVHQEVYRELPDEELVAAFDRKYKGRQREINSERLDKVARVCRNVQGEKFAEKCLARIRQNGHINAVQTYFALHYCADTLPLGNENFLKIIEQFGFDWFKEYRPPKDRSG